jgi:cell division protein FtsQ
MPLSSNFTARVPLVSGKIDRKNSEKYAELFRVIYDDDFLKKTSFLSRLCPMEG